MKPQAVRDQANVIIKAREKHDSVNHEKDEACFTQESSRAAFERGFMSAKMLHKIRTLHYGDGDEQPHAANTEQLNPSGNGSSGNGSNGTGLDGEGSGKANQTTAKK